MDTKFFRVMTLDGATDFTPTGSYNGKFYGVAKVTSEVEYERLKARGCAEIDEAAYQDEVKKKQLSPTSLDEFRPLAEVVKIAPPAASQPTSAEKPPVATSAIRAATAVPVAAVKPSAK